jgi:hypothetical protein
MTVMDYPATVELDAPDKVANWRPLVHWIMVIPHMIILYVLLIVGYFVSLISWFAIVITGKLPEGLANFTCMSQRYQMRVTAYAGFLHGEYPPFEFATTAADPGGTPVTVNFAPELEGRNRLTVALRLIWMIPAFIVFYIIWIVASICWFIAFFAVLFTGKWPQGLHNWAMKGMRASVRFGAYAGLLTDKYPPLNFD